MLKNLESKTAYIEDTGKPYPLWIGKKMNQWVSHPIEHDKDDLFVAIVSADQGMQLIAQCTTQKFADRIASLDVVNRQAYDILSEFVKNSREPSEGECIYCNCEDRGGHYDGCVILKCNKWLKENRL